MSFYLVGFNIDDYNLSIEECNDYHYEVFTNLQESMDVVNRLHQDREKDYIKGDSRVINDIIFMEVMNPYDYVNQVHGHMKVVTYHPTINSWLDDDGNYVWEEPCDHEYSYVSLGPCESMY